MPPVVSLFAAVLALAAVPAVAADAGLLTQISGAVTYQATGTMALPASSFMKIRSGDHFSVPAGASARVLYFANGRLESWSGPADFTIGDTASQGAAGTPQVSQLPTAAGKQLNQTQDLSRLAKGGRIGGVAVRGGNRRPSPAEAAEVQKAKETYSAMASAAAADDLAPELYLLAVCIDFSLQDEIGSVLDKMQAKQPGNETIQALRHNLLPAGK